MTHMEQNLRTLGRVLAAAQCRKCYYYPGMKGDELARVIDDTVQPSLNERNAFEFGYGACLAGVRTTVIMKTVGLATCLDSFQHAVIQGVHAGMVVVILEDTVAASSPEIVDSRLLVDYAATIMIEPRSMQSAIEHLQGIFVLSETLDIPIIVRLTFDLLNAQPHASVKLQVQPITAGPPPAYRQKMIGSWSERSKRYEEKQKHLDAYIENLYQAIINEPFDCICFGYEKNMHSSTLSIEHYPIAPCIRKAYAHHPVRIYEIGSNYATQQLHCTDRFRVDNTQVMICANTPFNDWEAALQCIDKNMYNFVVGDHGIFTFDSTGLVDVCLSMGSSIAVCAGMSDVTGNKNLAIIGDFSYLFNGYTSLLEAHARNANLDVVILDDGKASSTGGQISIIPVDVKSVAALTSSCESYEYNDLPQQLFNTNEKGIAIRHIKKDAYA